MKTYIMSPWPYSCEVLDSPARIDPFSMKTLKELLNEIIAEDDSLDSNNDVDMLDSLKYNDGCNSQVGEENDPVLKIEPMFFRLKWFKQ